MEINGKKVVDATRPMKISISKQDAKLGKTKDPGSCAAARAIIRSVVDAKAARVHLGRTYIEYPDKWVRYRTPVALKLEIVSFDRGAECSYTKGDFTLLAPTSTDRLGMRPKKPTGKTGSRKRRSHIARVNHQIEGVRPRGANR